eukprot:1161341-Pelagomonas_calceolata.AAC.12
MDTYANKEVTVVHQKICPQRSLCPKKSWCVRRCAYKSHCAQRSHGSAPGDEPTELGKEKKPAAFETSCNQGTSKALPQPEFDACNLCDSGIILKFNGAKVDLSYANKLAQSAIKSSTSCYARPRTGRTLQCATKGFASLGHGFIAVCDKGFASLGHGFIAVCDKRLCFTGAWLYCSVRQKALLHWGMALLQCAKRLCFTGAWLYCSVLGMNWQRSASAKM